MALLQAKITKNKLRLKRFKKMEKRSQKNGVKNSWIILHLIKLSVILALATKNLKGNPKTRISIKNCQKSQANHLTSKREALCLS